MFRNKRACISFAIEESKHDVVVGCHSKHIMKKYFNHDWNCKKKKVGNRFCKSCHNNIFKFNEPNGFAFFYKFYKCEICDRIGKPFCKLHTCKLCVPLDIYTVVLCLKQFKIPKDIIRYVLYPMLPRKMYNHWIEKKMYDLIKKDIDDNFRTLTKCKSYCLLDYYLYDKTCPSNDMFICKYCKHLSPIKHLFTNFKYSGYEKFESCEHCYRYSRELREDLKKCGKYKVKKVGIFMVEDF